jgi:isocitrate dehydrogenase
LEAAVKRAYGGTKEIKWFQVHAGLSALKLYGNDKVLPQDTMD